MTASRLVCLDAERRPSGSGAAGRAAGAVRGRPPGFESEGLTYKVEVFSLLKAIREKWTVRVLRGLERLAANAGVECGDFADRLVPGTPPRGDMGDLAFPLFPFAKDFRRSPASLARELAEQLGGESEGAGFAGPYINIRINRSEFIASTLKAVESAGAAWGSGDELEGRRIMIEFSSPNTNKPLHLGHLRNDILGESCSRILTCRGAEVHKVNLVNDRGIHICKSMLAYRKFAQGRRPEQLGVKSDRFVGDLYVQYSQWAARDQGAEHEAREMLRRWEAGDPELRELWETMNEWTLSGIEATYRRTGVSFDRIYRESETYLLGRKQVEAGLEKGVFYKDEDGSIRLDMDEIGLDTKVLLRSDGTSVYITQDLGTAVSRHEEWPFDQLIYVVGNEQEYHFRVLFFALRKLGFPWTGSLRHLSYGMVNLPDGRIKSREGTVVDADDLIDDLASRALAAMRDKERVADPEETAEKVALAALHYFLLQVSPARDMTFRPEESLAFNGNTGPYLQYTMARIAGLIAKAPPETAGIPVSPDLLTREDEWELIRCTAEFPELVERAAEKLDPSILAAGLYTLAKNFSGYYHEVPIARCGSAELSAARMALSRGVLLTLQRGFHLLNIPVLESM